MTDDLCLCGLPVALHFTGPHCSGRKLDCQDALDALAQQTDGAPVAQACEADVDEQPAQRADVAVFPVPSPLTDKDLLARLPLGTTAYYRHKKAGAFRFLELRPQLAASHTLYSRVLVDRWLAGELTAPVVASPAADVVTPPRRRFFGKARTDQVARVAVPFGRGR